MRVTLKYGCSRSRARYHLTRQTRSVSSGCHARATIVAGQYLPTKVRKLYRNERSRVLLRPRSTLGTDSHIGRDLAVVSTRRSMLCAPINGAQADPRFCCVVTLVYQVSLSRNKVSVQRKRLNEGESPNTSRCPSILVWHITPSDCMITSFHSRRGLGWFNRLYPYKSSPGSKSVVDADVGTGARYTRTKSW
jgi:hypothetical protein